MTAYHMCYDKAGLIVDVVQQWPVSWLTDDDGKPYGSPQAAVEAIMDSPYAFLPMDCPTPNEDGRCPGHER